MAVMDVSICNEYGAIDLSEDEIFLCIEVLSENCAIKFNVINVIFLCEDDICSMHERYLNDASPTDVITFGYSDMDEAIGEIYVSVDQAMKSSKELMLPVKSELILYIVHGWLHLRGYNDSTDDERSSMRAMEAKMMTLINERLLS